MIELRVNFFGGLALWIDERCINDLLSDKSLALFGFLVQESQHSHRREKLAGLFWPEKPERLARHSLSQAMVSLKKHLSDGKEQDIFLVSKNSIQINRAGAITTDIWTFNHSFHLVEACERNQAQVTPAYLNSLHQVAALYQGEFWANFFLSDCAEFEHWLVQLRGIYHQKALHVISVLVEYYSHHRQYKKALEYAYQITQIDKINEEGHQKIIELLCLEGQRNAAIAHFEQYRRIVQEELGVEPGDEITALHEQIRNPANTISPDNRPPTNLPAQLSPIVGRSEEVKDLVEILSNPANRLITILGTGGTGKTRLALETGWKMLPAFPNGVFYAEANAHLAKEALLSTIARAVKLDVYIDPITNLGQHEDQPAGSNLQEQLSVFLNEKELLLILDGLEQVHGISELAEHLLSHSPGLKILATSRVRLNLDGETVYFLEGLSYPTSIETLQDLTKFNAVVMYTTAAKRVNQYFRLTPDNYLDVAEICRLLEGIPLGILLASAWEFALGTKKILHELRQNVDFLSDGWLNLPNRQRSLRATFTYSWNLLDELEQKAFLHLSIFRNTFHIDRAIQISGTSPQTIKRLVDHSFIIYRGENLYRMHDLMKQFAEEKMDAFPVELQFLRQKFCQVYLDNLVRWHKKLKSALQFDAIQEMNFEYSNILAAWNLAIDLGAAEQMEHALDGLFWFYRLTCRYDEGLNLCIKTEECIKDDKRFLQKPLLLTDLNIWQASFLNLQGKRQLTLQILEPLEPMLEGKIKEMPGALKRLALTCHVLAATLSYTDPTRASIYAEKCHRLYQLLEDPWDISFALYLGAVCHDLLGNRQKCFKLAREAWELQRDLGSPFLGALIKTRLSFCYMMVGAYQQALELVYELLQYYSQINSPYAQASTHLMMGTALFHAGDFDEAYPVLEQAYETNQKLHLYADARFVHLLLGVIDLTRGRYAEGVKNLRALNDSYPRPDALCLSLIGAVYIVWAKLEKAEDYLAQSIKAFQQTPRKDHAGLPLAFLSLVSYRRGEFSRARCYLIEALEYAIYYPSYVVFHFSLSSAALLMLEKGEVMQALEGYQLVTSHPTVKNSLLWADLFQQHFDTSFASLPEDRPNTLLDRGSWQNLVEAGQQVLVWLKESTGWL